MDKGRTMDAGVIGILLAHLRAFCSNELKPKALAMYEECSKSSLPLVLLAFMK